ncbi:N-acetyltransferase [Aquimarina sp. RZ0]|uniref:GNAT family N-acetyltransferase n=1 Tax=Aquimarina sp. RZ0 TaxID=2607730 RepID=UPI0011F0B954|nr:GNAT family N-acetyltransferase [Aquimarina sp. RZ0]KAA1245878.1 GNAT family N-acetyltransferase [Aquimarina sp. RZ0]
MRVATLEDKSRIVDIISHSFDKNTSINYIVKQDANREIRLKKLIEYCFLYGLKFGKIFISEDENAACIILYPKLKKFSWSTVIWDLKLIFEVIGLKKVPKALKRDRLLKSKHPDHCFVHLWFIGVDPNHQKKRKGSKLLEEVVTFCGTTPIYLETSVASNIVWYQRFGFETVETIDLGYTLYILKKC